MILVIDYSRLFTQKEAPIIPNIEVTSTIRKSYSSPCISCLKWKTLRIIIITVIRLNTYEFSMDSSFFFFMIYKTNNYCESDVNQYTIDQSLVATTPRPTTITTATTTTTTAATTKTTTTAPQSKQITCTFHRINN